MRKNFWQGHYPSAMSGTEALGSPSPGQHPGEAGDNQAKFGLTGQQFGGRLARLGRRTHYVANSHPGHALGWVNNPLGQSRVH